MITTSEGTFEFHKSKGIYIILIITGIVALAAAFKIGFAISIDFLVPLAIGTAFIIFGSYKLRDKRPFISFNKDKINILGKPAITADNLQKITLETYFEKRKDAEPIIFEYIAFYVNDYSVFTDRLSIGYNMPQTPFHVEKNNTSPKEWQLLKNTLKNTFPEKADMRNVIQKAGDAIDDISNTAKHISGAFSKWKENAKAGKYEPPQNPK